MRRNQDRVPFRRDQYLVCVFAWAKVAELVKAARRDGWGLIVQYCCTKLKHDGAQARGQLRSAAHLKHLRSPVFGTIHDMLWLC
jgi:hypothetical protein